MKDPYRPRDWESHRDGRPAYPSDGSRNRSWDQDPYSDYRVWQSPSFPYDWQRGTRPNRPRSIQAAVALMCLSAGLTGLSVVYNLFIYRKVFEYGAIPPNSGAPGLLNVASAVAGIGSVLGSAIVIALWLWMASATSMGRSSARTIATVYFALGTLSLAVFLLEFRSDWHLTSGQGQLSTELTVGIVTSLVFWVLRLAIVVLLWRRESSAYFEAKAAGW
jgi:cytochrome bd-type quinol oxidase subunit 2